MIGEEWKEQAVELHTIRHATANIQASDGLVSEYIDGIGMLLCVSEGHPCFQWWYWLDDCVSRRHHLVGMGQSGAIILAGMGRGGTLLRPVYKTHGLEYNGQFLMPKVVDEVTLIDKRATNATK